MIYKIRVILDAKKDVFRDIAVEEDIQLEELHNAVAQAFGFDASEMAAFYNCDDIAGRGCINHILQDIPELHEPGSPMHQTSTPN